ncbi:unnamed protein product [Didymodactylos carnosus]|uniref:Peptidase M12A domain-containing protein n=1 Tax=Didymodactylos carnosus TaxID=1234261 RepID=A0A815TJM0_9BILA|nr:unnamed protein product [Didymodactylos carnosus]CAF4367316.1 unnamed protein product [Didymodactylos carnosus]
METAIAGNNVNCIQFRPRVASDLYYINITNGTGCSSYVGRPTSTSFNHLVTLQDPGCIDDGRVMHELLHTLEFLFLFEKLGFLHEQSRTDRDLYVRVNYANIQPGLEMNFYKYDNNTVDDQGTSYDYGSVMHYERDAFSRNGLPTIEPLQPNVQIGQRIGMSPIDILEVQLLYGCATSRTFSSSSTATTTSANCFPTSWNPIGTVVASGGYYGGLAVDDDFNVYVADGNHRRLQKWAPGVAQPVNMLEGYFSHTPMFFHSSTRSLYYIDRLLAGSPGVYKLVLGQTTPVRVAFGNGVGSALNQLRHDCRDFYVNSAGDIFVLDTYNQRVLKWVVNASSAILVAGGRGQGNTSTQLSYEAYGLYVDTINNAIYVADTGNNRIQKYTTGSVSGVTVIDATYRRNFSVGLPQLYGPKTVFVDRTGSILVGDWQRITKWTPDATSASLVAGGKQGSGANVKSMDNPSAFTFDRQGSLYVLDWINQRVLKFNVASTSCMAGIG